MATHVATCHGGKVDNVEGQIDPLLGEEDVEGDDMMLGEEKKEVVRRRRKGGAGGKEGKQLQCSHCQLQLDTIGELRTHVKVSCFACSDALFASTYQNFTVSLYKLQVMHEEQKTYQCTECNIKVSRKYHLVRHIKVGTVYIVPKVYLYCILTTLLL